MLWLSSWCGQIDMIVKVGDMTYDFSLKKVPSLYRHGDRPDWDNTGATAHLMDQFVYADQHVIDWIHENKMEYDRHFIKDVGQHFYRITFKEETDAIAFKLMNFAHGE